MSTPKQRYITDLKKRKFFVDKSQEFAVTAFEKLHHELSVKNEFESRHFFQRWLLKCLMKPLPSIKGLYLWGGVGRGKTYLMDNFYECLPFENKIRVHFHRFMRRVHNDLTNLEGEKNPLKKVAQGLAKEAEIICFDEFFVSDIADAMILAGLFRELFSLDVVLVTTSNILPDRLYENGLQRQRFLPAIALIKEHCEIINVDGGIDYRLRELKKASLYYWPHDREAINSVELVFKRLVPVKGEIQKGVNLEIEGRLISAIKLSEGIVWFDFFAICDGPRSQNDYIEIAREFQAVIISNVPQMGRHNEDVARRFIHLVDEFYDHNVKLALSAAEPINKLYFEGHLSFEFERTSSRLLEMQSNDYLSKPHKP